MCIRDSAPTVGAEASYKNVYGEPLESCSSEGMALTGYTRNGSCVDRQDDHGSHHVCINLSSASGGNFCQVTGQPNWCSSTNMPCHDNSTSPKCAIEHWCVCEWAFARYIERAGGCDRIQTIECKAINQLVLKAYQEQNMQQALECLVERCGLNEQHLVVTDHV